MATFVLVHGSAQSSQAWDLVKVQLERGQHLVITPELPAGEGDSSATVFAEIIAAAIPKNDESIVVAHSASGWFLPLVSSLYHVRHMVFLAAAVPRIGMSFMKLFEKEKDMINPAWIGKDPRNESVADEFLFHDCPPQRLPWAHSTIRVLNLSYVWKERYPLDQWPQAPVSSIVCSEDRTIQPAWSRRVAREQLGVEPMELHAGHCPFISRPEKLAELLIKLAAR
jgi:pimeloyl-ACP methyl ester carboxylesterase